MLHVKLDRCVLVKSRVHLTSLFFDVNGIVDSLD